MTSANESYDRQSPVASSTETEFSKLCKLQEYLDDRSPPSSNRGVEYSQELEAGGLDRLKLAFFGEWDLVALEGLKRSITDALEVAGEGKPGIVRLPFGDIATVKPYAPKMGGIRCTAQLEFAGLNVFIVGHNVGEMPALIVDAGSLRCMTSGFDLFSELSVLAGALGVRVSKTFISSVDMCVDLLDLDVESLIRAIEDRHISCHQTRCRIEKDGEQYTGVTLGSHDSPVSLNVYLKGVELLATRRDCVTAGQKARYLEKNRWGCGLLEARDRSAVRVEFRMRGKDFLKPRQVRTPAEYQAAIGDICKYLVSDWARVLASKPDRTNNHQTRCETHDVWKKVEAAFLRIMPCAMYRRLKVVRERAVGEAKLLYKQAIGCALRAESYLGNCVSGVHEIAKEELVSAFSAMVDEIEDERLEKSKMESLSSRSWFACVEIDTKLPLSAFAKS